MQDCTGVDCFRNHSKVACFENELALALLKDGSKEAINKVSRSILIYLKHTKFYNPVNDLQVILKDIEMTLQEKKSDEFAYPNITDAHKTFYELIFEPHYAPELCFNFKNSSLPQRTVPSLQSLAIEKISRVGRKASENTLSMQIFNRSRPDKFFHPLSRGRIEIRTDGNKYRHFGITDNESSQDWTQNFFSKAHSSAKNNFVAREESDIVKFFRQHQLPYISGASGTISHILSKILFHNVHLTPEEFREYLAILAAGMIALGHHSITEIMMVAAEFDLYHKCSDNGEIHLLKFCFEKSRNTCSDLLPKSKSDIYSYFLPKSFKESEGFAKLVCTYPDYFSAQDKAMVPQSKLHP